MLIRVDLPDDREEDLLLRYTVNLHYIEHLALWLESEYGASGDRFAGIASAVVSKPSYVRLKRRSPDLEAIQRALNIAWMSELQVALPGLIGASAVTRYSNAWAPVHAYYAVYLAMQAWFGANAMKGLTDDHSASLKTISTQIRDRDLFPAPWSLLAVGCPMRGERTYLNAPPGTAPEGNIEVLATPRLDDFWPRYGTWLRSTREARLTNREELWKKKHGKSRISSAERVRLAVHVWPTSFFDCLWRMRIRSNYRTVESHLTRFVTDDQTALFQDALTNIVGSTLVLFELYVARAIGGSQFASMAAGFIASDKHGFTTSTLQARLSAYALVAPFAVRT